MCHILFQALSIQLQKDNFSANPEYTRVIWNHRTMLLDITVSQVSHEIVRTGDQM